MKIIELADNRELRHKTHAHMYSNEVASRIILFRWFVVNYLAALCTVEMATEIHVNRHNEYLKKNYYVE